jgi:hypothetical protein
MKIGTNMKPTELKGMKIEWDEANKELLLTRDKFTFAIPVKYMGSVAIYIRRIYSKYLMKGIHGKTNR